MATSVSLVLLSLCFIAGWCFSSANFVFHFRLSSVTTSGTCSTLCNTYLTFCLRGRRRGESTRTDDCPLGRKSLRIDTYPLTRTQYRRIKSPRMWPVHGNFQMYVNVYEEDDHLDDIFINGALQVSNGSTEVMEYTGNNNRVTVGMSFRVRCQNNYYGADCDTFCEAQDDDENGHYTCNSDGSIQCKEGFENDSEYFWSVCVDCKRGFEKEGNKCVQLETPDSSTTITSGLVTTSVNQTEAHPRSGENVVRDSSRKTIISAIIVTVIVLILGAVGILVLVIVFTKLKRKKHYNNNRHQGEQTLTSMKSTEMIVPPEKMLDNPMYNSTEFITSSHGSTPQHPIEHVSPDRIIYATPESADGTLRVVENPIYGDSIYASNDYEKIQYVTENSKHGNSMDGEDPLYIFPQPLDDQTHVSTGRKSTYTEITTKGEASANEVGESVESHTYAVVEISKKENKQSQNKKPPLPPSPKH